MKDFISGKAFNAGVAFTCFAAAANCLIHSNGGFALILAFGAGVNAFLAWGPKS